MIEYIKHIFTIPEYQLSTLDKLAMCGIIIAGLAIVCLLVLLVCCIWQATKNFRRIIKAKREIKKYEKEKTNEM